MLKHRLVLTACVVALITTAALRSQTRNPDNQRRPFLGPPPPQEMQVLAPFVGSWTTKTTARPSSETKTGYTARGVLTGQWLHNGHFLRQEGFTESNSARIEFTHLTTYDRSQKVYRRWVFASTGLAVEVMGQWDEKTKTITWANVNPPKGESRVVKNVLDKDRFVETQLFKRADGTLVRDLTMTAVRNEQPGKASSQGRTAKDELDGTWDLVYFERDGKAVKPQQGTKAIITGSKFVIKVGDKVVAAGTFKLDASTKPKASETTYTDGPDKGKTFKGIYLLDGDMVKFCRAASPDQERPTEFKTNADNGGFVSVYKRARR